MYDDETDKLVTDIGNAIAAHYRAHVGEGESVDVVAHRAFQQRLLDALAAMAGGVVVMEKTEAKAAALKRFEAIMAESGKFDASP